MSGVRARIFVLVAAIALMLPSGAAAPIHYFCRMMDRAVPACCCAGEASHDTVRRAELRRPDCCEQVAKPARAMASTSLDPALHVPAATAATLLPIEVWIGEALSATNAAPRKARSPPSSGPPLFITHCSLLS